MPELPDSRFRDEAEYNFIATLPDGTKVWVFSATGPYRAAFLPTGLLDLRPLAAFPDPPPNQRIRLGVLGNSLSLTDEQGNSTLIGGTPVPPTPDAFFGGSWLTYQGEAVAQASEIQYARTFLSEGAPLTGLRAYAAATSGPAAAMNMGIYSQPDPLSEDFTSAAGRPSARLVESGSFAVPASPGFAEGAIAYAAPATGYYWIAYVTDRGAPKRWLSTGPVAVSEVPVLYEATAGVALPASASPAAGSGLAPVIFASARGA